MDEELWHSWQAALVPLAVEAPLSEGRCPTAISHRSSPFLAQNYFVHLSNTNYN
jgi:hypothetical protein